MRRKITLKRKKNIRRKTTGTNKRQRRTRVGPRKRRQLGGLKTETEAFADYIDFLKTKLHITCDQTKNDSMRTEIKFEPYHEYNNRNPEKFKEFTSSKNLNYVITARHLYCQILLYIASYLQTNYGGYFNKNIADLSTITCKTKLDLQYLLKNICNCIATIKKDFDLQSDDSQKVYLQSVDKLITLINDIYYIILCGCVQYDTDTDANKTKLKELNEINISTDNDHQYHLNKLIDTLLGKNDQQADADALMMV